MNVAISNKTAGACSDSGIAIKTEGLCKQFGIRKAVDKVSLEVPEGAFLSVFGPNGAGKTTLLRLLSTMMRPSAGTASIHGINLAEDPDEARALIGMISHEPMLYPDLNALENLELYAQLYGVENPKQRAMELLEAVELKTRRIDPVRTFSRGMTQRLSIARALINDPRVVFLDEPYSGLDPHAVEVFDELLAEVRPGRTFVMVSHDLERGYEMASHIFMMARGREVLSGATEDISFEKFRQRYRETVGTGVA